MGFPLMTAIYGNEGLIYTTMVNVAFNVLCYTLGLAMFTNGKNPKKGFREKLIQIALNPPIIVTIIAFAFFLLSLRLPGAIEGGVSLMAGMTAPLSMLIVGSILAKGDIKKVFFGWKMYVVIAFRLLIIPLVVFFAVRPFMGDPVALGATVLLSATPPAAITVIYAEQYGGDSKLASQMIFVSTILSLLTAPMFSLLL
jgi:predicted permease